MTYRGKVLRETLSNNKIDCITVLYNDKKKFMVIFLNLCFFVAEKGYILKFLAEYYNTEKNIIISYSCCYLMRFVGGM